jgi:hypothetical protein
LIKSRTSIKEIYSLYPLEEEKEAQKLRSSKKTLLLLPKTKWKKQKGQRYSTKYREEIKNIIKIKREKK